MARRSYAEMAAEIGMTVEEYKIHLQAKKDQPAPTAVAAPDADMDEADGSSSDEQVDMGSIKLVDSLGCFGIVYGTQKQAYVTLVSRNYYEVETVGTKGRGAGKVYAAGTYGAWKLAEANFPSTDARAVEMVAEYYYRKGMKDEGKELADFATAMRAAWNNIRKELLGDIAMRSMYTADTKEIKKSA